eukprot:85680_1
MFDRDYFAYGFNNIYWYLWVNPDYRLIECLMFEILIIVTFVMSISSLFNIVSYINKYKTVACHWSIQLSIGILSLSTTLSLSSFILLIYQQNGRHFNRNHAHCKIALFFIGVSVLLLPVIAFICIKSYLKWKLVEEGLKNNITWYELKTLDKECDMDLRHLVAVHTKPQGVQDQADDTLLLNEKTNEKLPENMNIVLNAHKSKYKLHLLSFVGQLLLFISVQYKNYYEENDKMMAWGHRFSKLINEDDYYIAKWELENGIEINPNESFETLEWMEYIARNNIQNN